MKLSGIIAGILLLLPCTITSGSQFTDYLQGPYVLKFVEKMPLKVKGKILIISTRNIKPDNNYQIKRGIQPWYRMFYFVAGLKNDTVYLKPVNAIDEAKNFLPKNRDFLVYVDGHGKTLPQVMDRGFKLTARFNINVVVFDWPTDYLALRRTVYNADDVSVNFVKAMQILDEFHTRYYNSSAVSVIFHSMGNRIIRDVANPRLLEKMPQHLFSNIIINSAAVKQQNHAKWVERLNIQKRIYITVNDHDRTLRGAMFLRVAEQLGMGPKGRKAINAHYVNFNSMGTTEHNLFLAKSPIEQNNPHIFRFYNQAFHGKEVSLTENAGFQILSPSEESLLFSVR